MKHIILALLVIAITADHLRCRKGLVDFYRLDSTVTGAGRSNEKMIIKALVSITCTDVIRIDGKDVLVQLMETTNVHTTQEVSGRAPQKTQYDKDYEKPLTFLQERNGNILRIIHDQNEKPSVISMKKSFLSNFVVKMAGQTGEEETQAGTVEFSYEKAISKQGEDIILKKAVRVLKQADPEMKRKDQKYQHTSYIKINPDGKIHRIFTQQGSHVGENNKRAHDAYQAEKTEVGQSQHPSDFKSNKDAADAFNFAATTTIKLVRTGSVAGDKVEVDKPEDTVGVVKTLEFQHYDDLVDETQRHQTLGLDSAFIAEQKVLHRQRLEQEVDFPHLLQRIRDNTQDQNLLAHAHAYVGPVGDKALDHVVSEYEKLNLDNADHLDYAISLLSLFTVAQSERGQRELVKAMNHPATVQQAIVNTVSLSNPSDHVIDKLRALSVAPSIEGLDEVTTLDVKTNAYFAYASSASKLPVEKSHVVLNEVIQNLDNVQTIQEFETQLHALGNLGDSAPLQALSVVAVNEHLPLELRVAAIHGLARRTSEESNSEVTNLLQHLTEKKYNEAVRTAAVNSLTKREAEIQDETSVNFLRQYLEDPSTPSTMVQAIKNYYLEVGTDTAHQILDATKLGVTGHIGERSEAVKIMALEGYFDEERYDSNTLQAKPLGWRAARRFFRRVGNGFKRLGQRIKNVAQRVGRAIVSAAKAVYNATIGKVVAKVKEFINKIKQKFSKAQFKNQKICIQSNSAGTQLCVYDEDMVAFIRKQGDISQMKYSRQFAFETLLGVEIMHVYIGMVGYAGTRIDCATNSFEVVIFGRGEAKASLFSRKLNILAAELELNKRSSDPLHDRAYLRVLGIVLFNGQFVPPKVRAAIDRCNKVARPLMKPVRKTFLQFSFNIVVVVVPLTFNIAVTGEVGVELVNIICPFRLTLTASVEPYVKVGIAASAGIGWTVLSGGVKADFESGYRLQPGFGTSNCNLCAVLDQTVNPITITISLYAKAFTFNWNHQLYQFAAKPIKSNLFKLCLFPNKPYNPDSVLE